MRKSATIETIQHTKIAGMNKNMKEIKTPPPKKKAMIMREKDKVLKIVR